MFKQFGMAIGLTMLIMSSPDIVSEGTAKAPQRILNGVKITNIKVRDMKHAERNLKLRELDGGETAAQRKTALEKQQTTLRNSITRDKGWEAYTVESFKAEDDTRPNWLLGSIFKVEMTKNDKGEVKYEVLAGSHRLECLENACKVNAAWLDFEVPCVIVNPNGQTLTDKQRNSVIIRDNGDGPEEGTVVKMSPITRFGIAYDEMPRCDYVCTTDGKAIDDYPDGKPVFVDGTPRGWTSSEYQRETSIGGSNHVPFSALTRLGRHFDVPVEYFNAARLRVKSQTTAAILTKTTPKGKGSSAVSELGKGFEVLYMEARATCSRSMESDEVFQDFRKQFLELMDINFDVAGNVMPDDAQHDGETAMGNTPRKTKEEREADAVEAKKAEEEQQKKNQRKIANSAKYAYAKNAIGNAFDLPDYPKVDTNIGNALDLLFSVAPATLAPATIVLAEYAAAPSDNSKALAAVSALIDALYTIPGVHEVSMKAEAAHAEPNTPKGKKGNHSKRK